MLFLFQLGAFTKTMAVVSSRTIHRNAYNSFYMSFMQISTHKTIIDDTNIEHNTFIFSFLPLQVKSIFDIIFSCIVTIIMNEIP